MIDIKTHGSPGWWLNRLVVKIDGKRKHYQDLYDRYAGDPPAPQGAENAREMLRAFQRKARLNLAETVVLVLLHRLSITAISTARSEGEVSDIEAWQEWLDLGGEVFADDVHRTFAWAGNAYAIVAADPDGNVAVTAEDPRAMASIHDPLDQRKIRAAAKVLHDEDEGVSYAYLYRPGRVYVARKASPRGSVRFSAASWDWDETRGGEAGLPLPAGFEQIVPVVRFRNREGVGEFERHVDLLDRINLMILQRMVVAILQAFKQRAIKVSPEDMPDRDPDTGELVDYNEIFTNDPGALWKLPQTAEMWESGEVQLTPILSAAKDDIQHLSVVTFTPAPILMPEGQNQSAEGANFAREGLTSRVDDRKRRLNDGWRQVIRLVYLAQGDERADGSISLTWAPSERYSLKERTAAARDAKEAGVPWRTRMSDIMQFSPEQVARMETERSDDAAEALLLGGE